LVAEAAKEFIRSTAQRREPFDGSTLPSIHRMAGCKISRSSGDCSDARLACRHQGTGAGIMIVI